MANKSGLMATLRAAARGGVRSEETEDDEVDMEEDEEETSPDSEGDDDSPDDEDSKDPSAEEDEESDDGEEDDEDEDEADTGPAAKATHRERARCIAIFTHANADANPNLAAKLLTDGTSKARATSLLDSVGGGKASGKPTGSLAARVVASQGKGKPGQDGGSSGGSKKKTADAQLARVASQTFGRRKAAANSNR